MEFAERMKKVQKETVIALRRTYEKIKKRGGKKLKNGKRGIR